VKSAASAQSAFLFSSLPVSARRVACSPITVCRFSVVNGELSMVSSARHLPFTIHRSQFSLGALWVRRLRRVWSSWRNRSHDRLNPHLMEAIRWTAFRFGNPPLSPFSSRCYLRCNLSSRMPVLPTGAA